MPGLRAIRQQQQWSSHRGNSSQLQCQRQQPEQLRAAHVHGHAEQGAHDAHEDPGGAVAGGQAQSRSGGDQQDAGAAEAAGAGQQATAQLGGSAAAAQGAAAAHHRFMLH